MKLRILSLFLMALLSFNLVACGAKTMEESETLQAPIIYIQRFEDFRGMFNCGFENFFGKIDLTSEHCSEGNTGAKIKVDTLISPDTAPLIHFDAARIDLDYDASDLSSIDYIGFTLYNANDFESTVTFRVKGENGSTLINQYCVLDAQSGEDYKIKVNRVAAAVSEESAVSYEFVTDCRTGVWYMDNFYAETAVDEVVIENRTFASDLLFDFENPEDANYILSDTTRISSEYVSEIGLTADRVLSSGNSLKLTVVSRAAPDTDESIQPGDYYTGFCMGKIFLENFDFTRLQNKDLVCDVFSLTNRSQEFIIRLTDQKGTVFDKKFTVQPNQKETLSLSFEDLSDSMIMLNRISKLAFYINYPFLDEDMSVFYFDNIKMQ